MAISTGDVCKQASLLPLAYNLTCYPDEPSCQNGSLPYPEDTLRDALVATALLQHVPLTTLDGVEATSSLQVGITKYQSENASPQ